MDKTWSYMKLPPGGRQRSDISRKDDVAKNLARDIVRISLPQPAMTPSVWDDWSDRGSHAAFERDELLPLIAGRYLGHGRNGHVHETEVKGVKLAWKKRLFRGVLGPQQRKEIEILKKISHQHIIKLVGTYTHRNFLGILLWPVAICDLSTLLEDLELLGHPEKLWDDRREDLRERLPLVIPGIKLEEFDSLHQRSGSQALARRRLLSSLGCIAEAMDFLHDNDIKHKDLKPSNILMGTNSLWITDFDASTDFSVLSSSGTEDGERGTPKYFAPEVAAYEKCGRPADIFSLGCIFLEMFIIACRGCMETLKSMRPLLDGSFHANLIHRESWFFLVRQEMDFRGDLWTMATIICEMLHPEPRYRPRAHDIVQNLRKFAPHTSPFFGPCCMTSKSVDTRSLSEDSHEECRSQLESMRQELRKTRADLIDTNIQLQSRSLSMGEELKQTQEKLKNTEFKLRHKSELHRRTLAKLNDTTEAFSHVKIKRSKYRERLASLGEDVSDSEIEIPGYNTINMLLGGASLSVE